MDAAGLSQRDDLPRAVTGSPPGTRARIKEELAPDENRFRVLGALLVVGGIAARIGVPPHAPHYVANPNQLPVSVIYQYNVAANQFAGGFDYKNSAGAWTPFYYHVHVGWSQTLYDLARIGGWALLVFGALIIAIALIREFRTTA